jgi:hypothetical protein
MQHQKNELTARIDVRIPKVSDFRVRLLGRLFNSRSVAEYWDAIEERAALGAEVSRMLKQLTDEQATMFDWQLGHPPAVMDKVAKQHQYDGGKVKILRLKESMGEVLRQVEGADINLSESEESVEPWVGLLERVALVLAETMDWTSRVESDVAALRTAMADGSARVEEIR